jgi:hypothetical protein
MNKNSTNKNFTITGIIMTIAVTIGLLWAGLQWKHRYNWPKPATEKQLQTNSIKAFQNLQLICDAQEKYLQTDWDNDGQKVYSRFLAHLWTTMSQQSEPVLIELIPKKLAFAMGPGSGVDGYYYTDIPERNMDSRGNTRKNDYTKEWAIAAVDASYNAKYMRVFLADNSGKILMKYTNDTPTIWPYKPLENGWEIITEIEQIMQKH